MEVYEKLGAFYLGRVHDLKTDKTMDDLVLYDSKDLLTHAFCVGMTGSGKTGLCVSLLEEAAIDGVPAIVIDPKGDLTNLMLTFPGLSASEFRPWINEDSARQKNLSPDEYAAAQAALWKSGLASWGQTGERIERLKSAADFAIYTPGSEAGLPVSILDSFSAPPQAILDDNDLLNERISTTVTSLLGLLDIEADPIKSREHILISKILEGEWKEGRSLDLGGLIAAIQNPPIARVGVLEMESFYPAKDRFILATSLNNLLASPSFESWLTGEPLDIDRMLFTADGKPRISIFCVAHLSETERMFFVSLLLNEVLGWMRTRSGTSSLRALIYMDEIFGYIPPVANPPSKKPLLTLLKQARAFGVGVVLATQNPVDLDYKGLSNTGTWFIGRLQTDRDKQRVLDGLEGASAGSGTSFDRGAMEEILAGLGQRVFLMHNVHEDHPVIFHSRWAMSYLAGPLTRQQIKTLMAPRREAMAAGAGRVPVRPAPSTRGTQVPASEGTASAHGSASSSDARPQAAEPAVPTPAGQAGGDRPVLPPDVPQVFLPAGPSEGALLYQPGLIAIADVHFVDSKRGVDCSESVGVFMGLDEQAVVNWAEAEPVSLTPEQLTKRPAMPSRFAALPVSASRPASYASWRKSLADSLYRTRRFELFTSARFKLTSRPGESERDFRIRLRDVAREERDERTDALRKKYAPKISTLEDRVRRAEAAVEREKQEASQARMQTVISVGATVLSAFLGRKRISATTVGKATTAARGVGRSARQAGDVGRAEESVAALRARLEELESEFRAETDALAGSFDVDKETLETVSIKPRKSDIDITLFALGWAPYLQNDAGGMRAAWS